MNEMNSLTLNGKRYDSFPDAELRKGIIKELRVLFTLSASRTEDVTAEGQTWTTSVPSVTQEKPYLWMRVSYTYWKKDTDMAAIAVEKFAGDPVIVGTFGGAISEDSLKAAVQEYLEKNPPSELKVDENTLSYEEGVLFVKTSDHPIKDDQRPITSGAVYEEFSKAVALLKTI